MSIDLVIGQLLADRFEVISLVGRGGMASVYKAHDIVLARTVAIKVFTVDTSEDRARIETEVRLLSGLNHPNLVTVHDAHIAEHGDDSPSYLVMEFVTGNSLREATRDSQLGGREIATIASDIGEALSVVHAAGIVHRDVKPANILIETDVQTTTGMRAKLADFGIAHTEGATRLTAAGTVLGTAGYLSPEQAAGSGVTSASDIYSLGLVLLEALTGHMEYPGSVAESLSARLSRDPAIPESVSSEWSSLLRGMLAREPVSRPSASEVALAGRQIEAGEPQQDPRSTDARTVRMPTALMPTPLLTRPTVSLAGAAGSQPAGDLTARAPIRRRLLVVAVIVAAALALGILGLVALQSHSLPSSGQTAVTSSTPPSASNTPSPTPSVPIPEKGKGHGKGHGKNK